MATDESSRPHRYLTLGPGSESDARGAGASGSPGEDTADIGELFGAIWRRKWFVLFWTVAVAALFFVLLQFQPYRYSAGLTLMLDPRQQQVVSSRDEVVSDLQLNNSILESEVAVLRSAALLERVVQKIGIDRFDGVDPANQPPGLVQTAAGAVKSLLGMDGDDEPAAASLIPPERRRLNRIVGVLREGIYVSRVGDSYVIQIMVTTGDPELSALVANGLANAYIEEQLRDRQRVAENATAWLANQVEQRRQEVLAAESEVESYKQEQLDDAGASVEVVEQQLAELNQQLAVARSDRATEEARLNQLETLIDERGIMAVAETQSSDYLTDLRRERQDVAREDARLAATLGENHPDRRQLATELERIDSAIRREVENIEQTYRNEIHVLHRREDSLQTEVKALEQRLSVMSASSLRLRQLEREADAARESFEELLTRLGEIRAQAEIQRAEAKVVSRAEIPAGPSSPRPKLMTAFGATLGLTGALVAALLMELLTSGFRSAQAVERSTGLKVLTTLPRERMNRPRNVLRLLNRDSYSLLAERVRQLRTMLASMIAGRQGGQSVLILSSMPNEGKTTTSIALADFYARSGVSTILLDLDTRRTMLQVELGIRDGGDLAEHLRGRAELDDVISRPDYLRFHMAGLGRHDKLWADEISASRLAAMIEELKKSYQMIIIDAPPVLVVSESLSLALAVDRILYLVRWKHTSRQALARGLATLANVGLRPSGLVLTMADTRADQGYGGDYSYN